MNANHTLPALCLALLIPACGGNGVFEPAIPEYVDCTRFPASSASAYVLPFAVGAQFTVSRTFGHYILSNGGVGLYAVDIPMPIGTPVHAMRAGEVVAIEERFSNDDRAENHENWVFIRHDDGTIGRYFHITTDGALVNVGDVVRQGDRIALSGNSGPSTAPHLHVDVQSCGPNLLPAYNRPPCGQTLPLSFRNTEVHACGLTPSRTYRAEAFTPASARE